MTIFDGLRDADMDEPRPPLRIRPGDVAGVLIIAVLTALGLVVLP